MHIIIIIIIYFDNNNSKQSLQEYLEMVIPESNWYYRVAILLRPYT